MVKINKKILAVIVIMLMVIPLATAGGIWSSPTHYCYLNDNRDDDVLYTNSWWSSPTHYYDYNDEWDLDSYASDGDSATHAVSKRFDTDQNATMYFNTTILGTIYGLKFKGRMMDKYENAIDYYVIVKVKDESNQSITWNTVYEGTTSSNKWIIVNFTEQKANAIKFSVLVPFRLYFEFEDIYYRFS